MSKIRWDNFVRPISTTSTNSVTPYYIPRKYTTVIRMNRVRNDFSNLPISFVNTGVREEAWKFKMAGSRLCDVEASKCFRHHLAME